MSYYGIRSLKLVKTEEGKFNYSCQLYDSCWRDDNGHRIWEDASRLYAKDYDTKEELEYQLFKDTLDGNIHGTPGKFSCISWNNRKFDLPEEQKGLIDLAHKKYRDTSDKYYNVLRDNNRNAEAEAVKQVQEEANRLRDEYDNLRYSLWYKAWIDYLQREKESKKHDKRCIVSVDNGGDTMYIKSISARRIMLTPWRRGAKVMRTTIDKIQEKLIGCRGITNIELIDV